MIISMSGGVAMMRRGKHPTNTPTPTPTPIPSYWIHCGDSETDGREVEPSAKNPLACFSRMWPGQAPTIDNHINNGVSGRSLPSTLTHCLTRPNTSQTWIHLQESGNQLIDGQRTPAEWGNTFQQGMIDIAARWPNGLYTYETAHSFSPARKAMAGRNWDAYNTELRARVNALAAAGITVVIVEVAYYIDLLIAALGYDTVCFPDTHPDAYHYQGIGNFCIALLIYKALNYDISTLNHSTINLNASHKSTAIALVSSS